MAKMVKTLDGLRSALEPLLRDGETLIVHEQHVFFRHSGEARRSTSYQAGVVVTAPGGTFNEHVTGASAHDCHVKFLAQVMPKLRPRPVSLAPISEPPLRLPANRGCGGVV